MTCKICASESRRFGEALVLGRHRVSYWQCDNCGFIQTDDPHWLPEAYSNPITSSDVGLIRRNLEMAIIARSVILSFFYPRGRFWDFGGGYGILTRIMRDHGFDFRHYDKDCPNLFAATFETTPQEVAGIELATAFDVVEHLVDPRREISNILARSKALLFSTNLVPSPTPSLAAWWYYGTEHGQHLSFFTAESLRRLAEQLGVHFATNGTTVHLLSRMKIPDILFRTVTHTRLAKGIGPLLAWRNPVSSLTMTDHKRAMEQALGRNNANDLDSGRSSPTGIR